MTKVSKALTVAWEAVSAELGRSPGYYHRRLQLQISLPAYAGVVVPGNFRRLSFDFEELSLRGLNLQDQTQGYLVEIEQQIDKKRKFVHLQQTPAALPEDLFRIFCTDVLLHVANCGSESESGKTLRNRLEHWRRFFQKRTQGGLSREEYIGLFAEIEFFEMCLQRNLSPAILSDAWQGVLGGNQDFMFGEIAVEVKAVTANDAGFFHVSNLRQLDGTGLRHLFLSHFAYDFREGAGRSMTLLIQSVRTMLNSDPSALAIFDDRLVAAGYIEPDHSPFSGCGFTERRRSYFMVREGFPRILESSLAPGVFNVCYAVYLAACSEFVITETDLIGSLPR